MRNSSHVNDDNDEEENGDHNVDGDGGDEDDEKDDDVDGDDVYANANDIEVNIRMSKTRYESTEYDQQG